MRLSAECVLGLVEMGYDDLDVFSRLALTVFLAKDYP
jgi:hypothetical protein